MRYKWKLLRAGVVLVAVPLLGAVVMGLWNWLMPALFDGVRQIDFLRAVGLLALCRILFGGFRGRGGWHRHNGGHGGHPWQRWAAMTEQEREQVRQDMRMARERG